MDPTAFLTTRGGAATWADLVAGCGAAVARRAVRDEVVVRVGRGRYALATAAESTRRAAATAGVVSYRSAAERHGWGQRRVPTKPDVTYGRSRKIPRAWRAFLTPHWSDLPPDDVDGWVTTPRRTLIDCMRMLKLNESVPIVDSAVRAGDITPAQLRDLARGMRGRGRVRAMFVATMATKAAANPFESGLRAIAVAIPGLNVAPQRPTAVRVPWRRAPARLHPDLVDEDLRIVIEAEGFEWHGEHAALARDCARYNAFAAGGWLILRFSWTQVTLDPAYVVDVLASAVALRRRQRD